VLDTLHALLRIFGENILPLLLLIAAGYTVQRRLGLEMRTLSRLNMYLFVPCLALNALSKAKLSQGDLLRVVAFVLALQACLFGLGRAWGGLRRYPTSLRSAFCCSLMFYNSGNYGYPLIALLFGAASPAVGLQAIVLATQNATTFSFGQMIIRGPHIGLRKAALEFLRMPFAYAVALGIVLQQTGRVLPGPLDKAVELVAGGLVPVALSTLGAQLALVRWSGRLRPVLLAALLRLLGGPALALGLLLLLGWKGLLAQQLLISSTVPTAVNTTILAIEFDNEPEFASQAVMLSTLLSALTVTVFIQLARVLFPL